MDALASKKPHPQTPESIRECGGTPTTVGVHKALAFNTLLSSQKTDTHHQNPHGPLRGKSPPGRPPQRRPVSCLGCHSILPQPEQCSVRVVPEWVSPGPSACRRSASPRGRKNINSSPSNVKSKPATSLASQHPISITSQVNPLIGDLESPESHHDEPANPIKKAPGS